MFEKKIDFSFFLESVEFWEVILEDLNDRSVDFFFLNEKENSCRIVFNFIEEMLFCYDVNLYFVMMMINMFKGRYGEIKERN